MRRNDFNNFNPRQYQEHLSPFGKKVLGTLLKQWNADRYRNSYNPLQQHERHNYVSPKNYAQRRVLTFGEPNAKNSYRDSRSEAINFEDDLVDDHPFEFYTENSLRPALNPTLQPRKVSDFSTTYDFMMPPPFLPPSVSHGRPIPSKAPPKSQNIPQQRTHLIPVPTSAELVTNITADPDKENVSSFSRDDLITSVDEGPSITDPRDMFVAEPFCNQITNEDDAIDNARVVLNECQTTSNVNWDNMFDTELLTDIDLPRNNITETMHKQGDHKIFNFKFHGENSDDKNIIKSKNADSADSKKNKRKKQTKVTDEIPKKVKKVKTEAITKEKSLPKNIFRKEKYTTAVKNWLNDVDPKNAVEELPEPMAVHEQEKHSTKTEKLDIAIDKAAATEKSKKVVQTQLANKGGIMKFGKPKTSSEKSNKKSGAGPSVNKTKDQDNPKTISEKSKETTKILDIASSENKTKDKVKEKKPKSKFVAPIKSQIPVKDVTYNIHEVDDTNQRKHGLDGIKGKDIIALLLYSNGFCQLNSQHTEDSCIAEAVLLLSDDNFFYIKGDKKSLSNILVQIFHNNTVVCYDGKALLIYLSKYFDLDIDVTRLFNIIDVKIAGSLLEPDNPPETFSALQRLTNSEPEFTISTTCMRQKAAWYGMLLQATAAAVRYRLSQEDLWQVFVDIEMRIVPIIADMEQRGVCVDSEKLQEMDKILIAKMKQVENECMAAAGRSFQINSTVQVRAILYDELKLDERVGLKVKETLSTGAKSTSESMLRSLGSVHPLPRLILEYRHLHKAHATFVQGIAQYVRGGVVKPVWVQTAAATGRIASSNPNLQAIPKVPFRLRLFPESADNQAEALRFRCVYVARPGHVLLAADWRHVECRVFARAAADTALQTALAAPDLFRRLAADWLKKPEEEISSLDRERTKRIVYASLYGAGPRKLMDILDVEYSQALSIAASFDRTFPSLRSFGRRVAEQCLSAHGRVATLCGRARTLPHISSADASQRAHAERQALNFIVQGSAADVCKLAMSDAVAALGERGVRARLLLQIHDELVWEVPKRDLTVAAEIIRTAMERCGERSGLPSLPVALAVGPSWGELDTYPTTSQDDASQPDLYQPDLQFNL